MIRFKLGAHAKQSGLVWHADDNDIWDFAVRAVTLCNGICRVIRLDYLMLKGKVLPDENVKIFISDLCHNANHFIPHERNLSRDFIHPIK